MSTADQHPSDAPGPIDDTLRRINRYWRRSGVPRPERQDRLAELHSHLLHAADDGRDVSEIIGPDTEAFAAAWIQADRSHPRLDAALRAVSAFALGLGAFTLIAPAIGHPSTTITTQGLGGATAAAAAVFAWEVARMHQSRTSNAFAWLAALGIATGVVLALLVLNDLGVHVNAQVPWPAAAAILIMGAAGSAASWTLRRTNRTRRGRGGG